MCNANSSSWQRKGLILIVFFSQIWAISACDTIQKKDCSYTDWFEKGRQHGFNGLSVSHYDEEVKSCESTEINSKKQYLAGHSAGQVEYCSEENVFYLGFIGLKLPDHCQPQWSGEVLEAYNRGQKASQKKTE